MTRTQISNKTRIGLIAATLAGGMNLASSAAFAVEALPQGYQLAAADKSAEGKCGEGKCGAAEASGKSAEGKCGEGKCGAAEASNTKAAEGKCGEASAATPPSPVPTPTATAWFPARSC
jgi:uncharacterized low-complexity protein